MKRRTDERLIRDVARRVAELREAAEMTQHDLAGALKISDQYTRKLESGTVNVSVTTLNHLAKALDVDVTDFFIEPASRQPRGPGRPKKRSPSKS